MFFFYFINAGFLAFGSCYLTLNLIIVAFNCSHYNNHNIYNIITAKLFAEFKYFITFFHLFPRASSIFYFHLSQNHSWNRLVFFFIKLTLRYTNFPSSSELSDVFFKTNKCKWKLTLKYGVCKSVVMEYGILQTEIYVEKAFQQIRSSINMFSSVTLKKKTHTARELLEFKWNFHSMSSMSFNST